MQQENFRKSRRNRLGIAFAVIVVFTVFCSAQLYWSYKERLQALDDNLETLSLTLIKQAEAEFRATEIALRFAQNTLQEGGNPDDWSPGEVYEMFTGIIETFNAAESSASPHDLFWVNSQGRVRVTSYSNPTPEIEAADRDYFKHHKSNASPDVYFSGTLQSRLTSRWVVYQTVRLNDRNGNFAGAVGITTRIDAFELFYRQLNLPAGSSIIIAHREGRWSYRFPFDPSQVRVDFFATPEYKHTLTSREGQFQIDSSPFDGKARRVGFYWGDNGHLLAAVTLTKEAARAQFYPALQERGLMLIIAVAFLLCAVLLYDRAHKRSGEALRLANIDDLTQVPNRRSLEERLQWEWRSLQRSQECLGLLFIDVDFFKRYNDRYGHEAGDLCLTQVARVIQQTLRRPDDFVARYGGEEFIVLLPGNNYAQTEHMAELILEALREARIPHEDSPISAYLTASIGFASMLPRDGEENATLKEHADRALYQAKHAGRDCVRGYRGDVVDLNSSGALRLS